MGTLRIVGGALGGRRLPVPKHGAVRPTSERVREAVASALEARGAIEGADVLDLFTGSGALTFEMLSRGARRATAVDHDRRLLRAVDRAARTLGIEAHLRTRAVDLLGDPTRAADALAGDGPFTLVLVDPPYDRIDAVPALLEALIGAGVVAPGAFVMIEHATKRPPPPTGLASVARYRYGDTAVELGTVPAPENRARDRNETET